MNILHKIQPKYSLIPGTFSAPELINLDAIQVLRSANAIVYDQLANTDLFKYAPKGVPLYYTGHFTGNRSQRAAYLNELILELTYSFGHVVHIQGIEQALFQHPAQSLSYIDAFNIETNVVSITNVNPEIYLN